jgi:hypothetical protein
MWHPKLRGYMYEIVECFPAEQCDMGIKVLHVYDRLEDAETVMAALESVNYNFTCYGIMLRPVWEDAAQEDARKKRMAEWQRDWDANGSPTF